VKGRAFDYLQTQLSLALDKYSYDELSTFLSTNIPDVNQYPFTQALDFGSNLRKAFFDVKNITNDPVFMQGDFTPVPFATMKGPPHLRPPNISMLKLEVTVFAFEFAPDGIEMPTSCTHLKSNLMLELSQSTIQVPDEIANASPTSEDSSVSGSVRSATTPRTISFPPSTPAHGSSESANGNAGWTSVFRPTWRFPTPAFVSQRPPSPPGPAPPIIQQVFKTTFTGDADIVVSQAAFDAMSPNREFVGHAKYDLELKHNIFVKACQFFCLIQLLRQDYVGRSTDNMSAVNAVVEVLDTLVMTADPKPYIPYVDRVTTLFNDIMTLVDLLPDDASQWGFNVVQSFFLKLLKEIRDDIRSKPEIVGSYTLPQFSTLVTKASQVAALRTLRSAAIAASESMDKTHVTFETIIRSLRQNPDTSQYSRKQSLSSTTIAVDGKKTVAFAPSTTSTPSVPDHNFSLSAQQFLSPAERTIQQNTPSGGFRPQFNKIPLTYGMRNGEQYPMYPVNGYVSEHKEGFRGCFACGSLSHFKSSDCPLDTRNDEVVRTRFLNELFAHKPHMRKPPNDTTGSAMPHGVANTNSTPRSTPPPVSSYAIPYTNAIANSWPSWLYPNNSNNNTTPLPPPPTIHQSTPTPAPSYYPPPPDVVNSGSSFLANNLNNWQPPLQAIMPPVTQSQQFPYPISSSAPGQHYAPGHPMFNTPPPLPPPPTPPEPKKRPRYFVQKVQVRNHKVDTSGSIQLPPMPINIDNGFPNLILRLGSTTSLPSIELQGLLDTCGSLNTGYLPFHAYLAHCHPEMVVSFRFHNGEKPFESIRLMGAVPDSQGFDTSLNHNHGVLTAVVCYKTPYVTKSSGDPITISFALGHSVTTNTIFGLPMITAFGFLVDAVQLSAYSKTVEATFPLVKADARLGLPDNVSFDFEEFQRMHSADSITSTSMGHIMPSDAFPHVDDSLNTSAFGIDDMSCGYLRRSVSTFSQSSVP
jgi:hypothetical protein